MIGPLTGAVGTVTGSPDFALLHEGAMPQKDQLCGAFWGSLTLSAAGHQASQEEVALRAGTTLAEGRPCGLATARRRAQGGLRGDPPRRVRRGLGGNVGDGGRPEHRRALRGHLAVVPVAGPWSAGTVVSLVEIAARTPECVMIANLRTGHLWGSRPPARLLLDYLHGRQVEAPPPDWDCGHFLTIAACAGGPGGALVVIRDTYPQLGWNGYHLQPAAAVAVALDRGDGYEGGVLCACESSAVETLTRRLGEAGFEVRHWDNGSPDGGGAARAG